MAKYYPEVHVVLSDGTLMSTISPSNKNDPNFGSSFYMDNFRDDHLKINDDRKVRLTLSDFKDRRDMMILLTVRMNDLKSASNDKSTFAQAWFRLQNEDTNQTLDYSYIDKVKEEAGLEEDEEGEENQEEEGSDAEPKAKKETIFLCGRLYREDIEIPQARQEQTSPREGEKSISQEEVAEPEPKYKTKWVYERWNKVVTSDEFPNVPKQLGEILKSSRQEMRANKDRVREAKQAVLKAAEEKKALAAALAAKKSKAANKGKGKKDEAPAAEEDDKKMPDVTIESEDGDFDLNNPQEFMKALAKECPRPFTFGPIEFNQLNMSDADQPFDYEEAKQRIIDSLDLHMQQPSCCIRGHTVQIKGRNLKRRSTMLKHGRFMQNLMVSPVLPKVKEVIEDEEEGEGEEAGSQEE